MIRTRFECGSSLECAVFALLIGSCSRIFPVLCSPVGDFVVVAPYTPQPSWINAFPIPNQCRNISPTRLVVIISPVDPRVPVHCSLHWSRHVMVYSIGFGQGVAGSDGTPGHPLRRALWCHLRNSPTPSHPYSDRGVDQPVHRDNPRSQDPDESTVFDD